MHFVLPLDYWEVNGLIYLTVPITIYKIKKEKNQLHAPRVDFIRTLTYLKDGNDPLQGFDDAKVTGGLLEQCSSDQSTDDQCCFVELFAAKQTHVA